MDDWSLALEGSTVKGRPHRTLVGFIDLSTADSTSEYISFSHHVAKTFLFYAVQAVYQLVAIVTCAIS